jgi:diguanylate cyclase (GGDEF)-like protein
MKNRLKNLFHSFKNKLNPPLFNQYKMTAQQVNSEIIVHLIIGGLILSGIDFILQNIIGHRQFFGYCFYFMLVFVFLLGCIRVGEKNTFKHATVKLYILVIALLIISMILSFSVEPEDGALLFMVFLCVLPALIFDKPWRIILMIIAIDVLYLAVVEYGVQDVGERNRHILYTIMVSLVTMVLAIQNVDRRLKNIAAESLASDNAAHDPLTGLLNRRGGLKMIDTLITSGVPGAFIIIDIDNFKRVNDTYGHKCGDEVLERVAETMHQCFRVQDVLMRYGGDELVVYAVRMADRNTVSERLDEFNKKVQSIVLDEEKNDVVTVSIGCCINDGTYPSYESCFTIADQLLYKTKQSGKNSFRCVNYSYDEGRNRKYQTDQERRSNDRQSDLASVK